MQVNPLDSTAAPFLVLYTTWTIVTCWICVQLRGRIGPAAVVSKTLNPLELAYLSGGPRRLGDALLVGLLTSKAATLSADGRIFHVKAINVTLPPMTRSPPSLSGAMTRAEFQEKIKTLVDGIRTNLSGLGLSPSRSQLLAYRVKVVAIMSTPVLLGIVQVDVGDSRQRPVGILITLIMITLMVGISLLTDPQRTWAGNKALEAYIACYSRAARAPLESELMLAVALTGPRVLSGTAYDAIFIACRGGRGGGGGCGGGGCGGGGCGGGGCGGG